MYIKRLLYTKYSKLIISIILGLGLACLFRKTCKTGKCLQFLTPDIDFINNNILKFGDKCYKMTPKSTKCNQNKKIIRK